MKIRLVADVPVGAFLSGGIDSTTVVAEMCRHMKSDNLHTVSVGFEIPGLDETPYVQLAQREYGSQHHHIVFHNDDIDALAGEVASIYDEPVADHSSFPTLCLCKEARRWMTVALSGDGGDEVFGGYTGRQIVTRFMTIRRVPRLLRHIAHAVLSRLYGYRTTRLGRLAEALRVSLLDAEDYFAEIGATLVYRPPAFKRWAREKLAELLDAANGNLAEAMLKFDIYYNRLGDNYAAKVDRMSMAYGLEVRSPFLDYRFMEYASTIPVRWKLTPGKTKVLLKQMIRGLIPDAIIDREKHGFAAPLGLWTDENEGHLEHAVLELTEAGVLDKAWRAFYVERVLGKREAMYREYKKRLYFLWQWYERWVKDEAAAAPTAADRTRAAV